jgi:hypothetical protein
MSEAGALLSCARAATAGGRPGTARNLEKQVELLDNEAEGHHRDGGAHPGEEGTLVCRMVCKISDHGEEDGRKAAAVSNWRRG